MADTDRRDASRLETFSDGVYAVVITLLALDLKPELATEAHGSWALLSQLASQWPTYLAFVTSFGTVLIMWVNHHGMFKFVRRVDTKLLFANGFLLMLTTLVPFTTALLSAHFMEPSGSAAGAVYGGLFVLINVAYNLTWHVIVGQHGSADERPRTPIERRISRNFQLGFPAYLVATVVALWNLPLSIAICAALWALWSANMRPVHDRVES
jgi:uncharacterized membrane protein